jgi:hypothetical protein
LVGTVKYLYGTPPFGVSAGTLNACGIWTTASGLPIFHSDENVKGGGRSRSSPRGMSASSQAFKVCFSWAVSRRSLLHVPKRGSACQGGMRPSSITSRMVSAQATASSYFRSAIGPICPGRWHS